VASQTAIAPAAKATIHLAAEPPAPRADSNDTPASASASSAKRVPSARRLPLAFAGVVALALVLRVPPLLLLVEGVLVVSLFLRFEILLVLLAHARKDLRKSLATILH
jgi:hypothetical protein